MVNRVKAICVDISPLLININYVFPILKNKLVMFQDLKKRT